MYRPTPLAVAAWLAQASLAPAAAGEAFCCANLEDRVAALEGEAASKGTRRVSLDISGIVTWPVMAWDDGAQRDVFVVTNEVKRPRLRFSGMAKIDAKWAASFALELGPAPDPREPMDQHNYVSSAERFELRTVSWALRSADWGQVSLGLQSEATDFATESTLANTAAVVSPGLPILLGYVNRGYFMRRDDGVLTGLRFSDIIFRGRNDIWGEGHRWNVLRYDAPSLAGFIFSASWGEDDVTDAALHYSGAFGRLKVAAAIGVTAWNDGAGQRGCALQKTKPDVRCWETGGSLALKDTETGFFLNLAAGLGRDKNVSRLYNFAPGLDRHEDFYYAVGGIEKEWLSLGPTTLFGQYWHRDVGAGVHFDGGRIDATPLGALPLVSGADVTLYGVSGVQTLASGVDLYASLNRVETEVRTSATGGEPGSVTTHILPFEFLIAGLSVKF